MNSDNAKQWVPHQIDAVTALIDENFPQARIDIGAFVIEQLSPLAADVRLPIDDRFIRPGGSVSGPTMFKLADLAAWVAILSECGPTAVDTLIANMRINFLARPSLTDLVCQAQLLRLGRRLTIAECKLYSMDESDMVAHATCSYAMPKEHPGTVPA